MCRVVDTLYTQSGASPLWLWEEAHHTFDGDGRSKLSAHMDQVDGELEEKNSNASMVRTCVKLTTHFARSSCCLGLLLGCGGMLG